VISLLLCSCDSLDHCSQREHNFFAEFKLRIRDQIHNKHVENLGKSFFFFPFSIISFSIFVFWR
jgi:hypothetical protein